MEKEIFTLGQFILKYKTPQSLMNEFNKTYDNRKKLQLKNANRVLVGKIKNEFTLYDSHQDSEHTRCDHLSPESYKWFMSVFKDYLDTFSPYKVGINLSFVWINEMKSGEYNPVHYHSSSISFSNRTEVLTTDISFSIIIVNVSLCDINVNRSQVFVSLSNEGLLY